MTKQGVELDQKIESMTDFARQVRRTNTYNPERPQEPEGYFVTRNTAFLLEGHSPFNHRKVRGNQRDRIIWEVLENLDRPYFTASDRHIWEEVCVGRLLEAATSRYANPKADVIVTGIKVPEWYTGGCVDPVKYAEQLAEMAEKQPVFVSTGIRNQRVYDVLNGTRVNLVSGSGELNEFMGRLVTEVFPRDERTPERRHRELMGELMGSWQTQYIIGTIDGTLEPKIGLAVRELSRK